MNRTRKPKSVSLLLTKTGLQRNTSSITKLNILLQSYLKQHNIHGCRVGNLQNGRLQLEIPDATWLIRLKFMHSELLTELRKEVPGLLKIKMSVNPELKKVQTTIKKNAIRPTKRASKMPADIAQSFLALAEEAEPGLQKALRSLAKYSK